MTRKAFVVLELRLIRETTPAWAERRHAVRRAERAARSRKPKYKPKPQQVLLRGQKCLADRLLEAAVAQGLQPGDLARVSDLARSIGARPDTAHVVVSHMRHAGRWPYKSTHTKEV